MRWCLIVIAVLTDDNILSPGSQGLVVAQLLGETDQNGGNDYAPCPVDYPLVG